MRESRFLEYKASYSKSSLKTVSAFANYGTGKILFGVDDQGNPCGLDDPEELCLRIENAINDALEPRPDYQLTIDEDSHIVSLTVWEGERKPYTLSNGKAYRRYDSSCVEVDRAEFARLVLEGENRDFEELSYKKGDLSFNLFERKLIEQLGLKELNLDILKTLKLASADGSYNNAAALLADSNEFPGIDMAKLSDDENIFLDRESYEHVSVLELFERALAFYQRHCQIEKIGDTYREHIDLVPKVAFREALTNALIHRTWDVYAHVKIAIYQDRLEIISPGGIVRGYPEELLQHGGTSTLRNPRLAEALARLNMIEKFGTGIRRIHDAYMQAPKQPQFKVSENFVTVVLPFVPYDTSINPDEKNVLNSLSKYRGKSRSEIEERTDKSKNKVLEALNSLCEKGLVIAEGKGRARRYKRAS